MASNDPEVKVEMPSTGPVAFLERIVRLPAANDQNPLRIACLLVMAGVMAFTPMPFQVIGFVTLVVLALSYGRIRKS
jgi:hypothetical protein